MILYILLAIIVLVATLWIFGPREQVSTEVRFDPASIGDDVDVYLARAEAAHPDIEDGLQKEVIWAFPESRAKTPVALVYVHGFSASRGETYPLTETAAETLGANIYHSRLTGHGRAPETMADPLVQDWIDDLAEAVEIGNRIGEKTVLVTISTGGTIAAIGAFVPEIDGKIDGVVFMSPNFKLANPSAPVLTMPFARTLVPLLAGETRSFEPENELHRKYWTETYPSLAVLPMAAAVKHANTMPFERATIPALFVFSDADNVVDHTRTREIYDRWGGAKQIITVDDSADPYNHVIAGDALSPNTTERLAGDLSNWVNETVLNQ